MDDGLRSLLGRRAEEDGEATATYVPDGTAHTYAELWAIASELGDRLPPAGSRIAVQITNSPEGVAAVHGCWRQGCSAVMISPALPERERERRIREIGCAAVVDVADGLRVTDAPGPVSGATPDEAVVMFTSGTTGRPKGAVLGFGALGASLSSIGEAVGMPRGRRPRVPARTPSLTVMPLSHVGGFLSTVNAMFLGKPSLIVDRWRVEDIFGLVDRFGLTLLRLAPAMLHDLVHIDGARDLGPVKTISVGSAALSDTLRQAVEDRYGVVVLNNYGQTELSGAIAFERYEDVVAGRRPAGSVGRIAPGVQVRIVDEQGRDLPNGRTGEIWAKSRGAVTSYVHDGASVDPRRSGWIATGDMGSVDDEGFVYLSGRARDVIVSGGFNVYPATVEAALGRLSAVTDAAVTGVPDPRLGEVVVAAVVPAPGEVADGETLRRALREELPAYEIPRHIVAVERIPLTPGGKPDRERVRSMVTAAGTGRNEP